MKNTIKLSTLLVLGIMSTALFTACKKGENDPGLSLRSRKSRVTGEWKLKSFEGKNTDISGVTIITYDGTNWSETDIGSTYTYAYSETLDLKKDGSFIQTQVRTPTGGSAETTTIKGYWSFVSANKAADYKNKEILSLSQTSYAESGDGTCNCTSYSEINPYYADMLPIDQLKNKEMIIKIDNTSTSTGSTHKLEYTLTYTQE